MSTSPRVRLLVVEDELSTVFAMREFFTQAGYDVDCAAGFSEAVQLIERQPYQAVITDLHLTAGRRAEGMKVAWHARHRNPQSYIVMLTAYGSETAEEDARRSGVDLYQLKPVELTRLSVFVDLAVRADEAGAPPRLLDVKCRQH